MTFSDIISLIIVFAIVVYVYIYGYIPSSLPHIYKSISKDTFKYDSLNPRDCDSKFENVNKILNHIDSNPEMNLKDAVIALAKDPSNEEKLQNVLMRIHNETLPEGETKRLTKLREKCTEVKNKPKESDATQSESSATQSESSATQSESSAPVQSGAAVVNAAIASGGGAQSSATQSGDAATNAAIAAILANAQIASDASMITVKKTSGMSCNLSKNECISSLLCLSTRPTNTNHKCLNEDGARSECSGNNGIWKNRTCTPKKQFGESCEQTRNECDSGLACLAIGPNTPSCIDLASAEEACDALPNYYWDTVNKECLLRKTDGQRCTPSSNNCQTNLLCLPVSVTSHDPKDGPLGHQVTVHKCHTDEGAKEECEKTHQMKWLDATKAADFGLNGPGCHSTTDLGKICGSGTMTGSGGTVGNIYRGGGGVIMKPWPFERGKSRLYVRKWNPATLECTELVRHVNNDPYGISGFKFHCEDQLGAGDQRFKVFYPCADPSQCAGLAYCAPSDYVPPTTLSDTDEYKLCYHVDRNTPESIERYGDPNRSLLNGEKTYVNSGGHLHVTEWQGGWDGGCQGTHLNENQDKRAERLCKWNHAHSHKWVDMNNLSPFKQADYDKLRDTGSNAFGVVTTNWGRCLSNEEYAQMVKNKQERLASGPEFSDEERFGQPVNYE